MHDLISRIFSKHWGFHLSSKSDAQQASISIHSILYLWVPSKVILLTYLLSVGHTDGGGVYSSFFSENCKTDANEKTLTATVAESIGKELSLLRLVSLAQNKDEVCSDCKLQFQQMTRFTSQVPWSRHSSNYVLCFAVVRLFEQWCFPLHHSPIQNLLKLPTFWKLHLCRTA